MTYVEIRQTRSHRPNFYHETSGAYCLEPDEQSHRASPFNLRRSVDRCPAAGTFYRSPSCFNAFQLPGLCNFTNRHLSFIIGLFCWQTVKQNNKCVTVHGTGTV